MWLGFVACQPPEKPRAQLEFKCFDNLGTQAHSRLAKAANEGQRTPGCLGPCVEGVLIAASCYVHMHASYPVPEFRALAPGRDHRVVGMGSSTDGALGGPVTYAWRLEHPLRAQIQEKTKAPSPNADAANRLLFSCCGGRSFREAGLTSFGGEAPCWQSLYPVHRT